MNAFGYGSGLMNRLMISEKTRKSRESLGCGRDFDRVTYSKADARQVLLINQDDGFWVNLKLMQGG